jgi:holo-[acyl-carrier protein] synthase
MIVGIGSDLTRIDRIAVTLQKFGTRFEARCFTDLEQARARRRPDQMADTYAKRFAAKEACAKALGTGMMKGVAWRDMGVENLPTGRPTMRLTGGALKRLHALMPQGYVPDIHLSLTDDDPYALAFVVISAVPAPPSTELPIPNQIKN